MPPTIRIRIVAAVDASLANVFVPFTTAAKRAGAQIGAGLAAGATTGAAPYRSLPAQVGAPLAQAGRAGKALGDVMGSVADGTAAKFRQLSQGLKAIPADLKAVASEAQRELSKIERMKARDSLGLGPSTMSRLGYTGTGLSFHGAAHVGMRIGMGAVHAGTRLASDMVHGLGVRTDLGEMFSTNQHLETVANDVSNFGYMPGSKNNGRRIDPSNLIAEAHKTAQETGNESTSVLEGLEKFVGLTGDLATGRESMKDLAVLAKATGSNLTQMVEAAGNVSNVLGDIPDKGKAVYDVMRAVAGEGKTGAVLIKDLAVQMAKVAAGAQMFAGDRGTNIAILGAIAQEARGRGGSASAAQAATSVSSFVNTFSKGARIKAFKGFNVELQGTGGLRDPREIIVDALNAAMHGGVATSAKGKKTQVLGGEKNFSQNLGAMFMDVRARSAVRGFESIYRENYSAAKGGEREKEAAATAAVRAEFERLTSAAMSQELVLEDFRIAMATSKSKVDVFNDKLGETAGELRETLLPAFVELAPAVLAAATALSGAFASVFGRAGAPEVKKDLENFNSLEPIRRAVHAGNAGPSMHFDPTQGDFEEKLNPVTGKVERSRSGMWVPDVATVPEGAQSFVEAKRSEAQQELERQKAKQREAQEAFRKYESPEGYQSETEDANATLNDPAKLRQVAGNPFSPLEANLAQNVIAANTGVSRAESGLGEVTELADKLADGIQKRTLQVVIMNPEAIKPPAPPTSPNVGNPVPGQQL